MKRLKTGGRQKGTPNKKTALINAFINYLIEDGKDKFTEEFNKLSGKDYTDCFLSMVKLSTNKNVSISANQYLCELLNEKIKNKTK